jgi:hypothetical protein
MALLLYGSLVVLGIKLLTETVWNVIVGFQWFHLFPYIGRGLLTDVSGACSVFSLPDPASNISRRGGMAAHIRSCFYIAVQLISVLS